MASPMAKAAISTMFTRNTSADVTAVGFTFPCAHHGEEDNMHTMAGATTYKFDTGGYHDRTQVEHGD